MQRFDQAKKKSQTHPSSFFYLYSWVNRRFYELVCLLSIFEVGWNHFRFVLFRIGKKLDPSDHFFNVFIFDFHLKYSMIF